MESLQAAPGWVVVALEYELGYLLEPKSAPAGWMPGTQVLARFWRFAQRVSMVAEEADDWLHERAAGAVSGIGGLHAAIEQAGYTVAVERIKELIAAGDCYQVNFTFPLSFDWFGSTAALYARLRQRQPVRYGGFVGDGKEALVSLSPELFLERVGNRLMTRPMKGTAPRSAPAEQLRQSTKDRAENLMIVDLLRNDLGRVAQHGSVVVDRLFDIEDYPTVWQMVSEVSATVGPQVSFGDILRALFPCGSITGAPKIRAMQIAADLESTPRGLYTGALGWLAPNGDFRLNVAIRTLVLQAGGKGRLGVGSGIVADSEIGAEWAECHLKARFLRDDDPGLQLIETLRREEGVYPRLQRHLDRLHASAGWLGFGLDESQVLAALAAQPQNGTWRVRLTLAKDGDCQVASFPLAGEPPGIRHAVLAATPIDSAYPLRRHKTTDRALYDEALMAIVGEPVVFDQVFLNERGEVAEGARSNVFVEREGILLTPPLSSGALPGVLRAELLAEGRAREQILWPADLEDGFWLGNALRGLVRVALRQA
ncbi:aminodeoxychorismate synthase component I [Dechloromonas sp. XY25]|uniref:Aminodeoxychorismate synthase component I n=1 Tax=Dechloromonas hankyongensis TaxID=2908002 RepID=A0ABS9K5B7_9RHOO|nr:aminodeoxychorismate synthase component I [Dechloromonas hankyongensis]MCG2578357.1 aminodeoxychorismate synthase component I [Dechloromonas hankyongensis]